MQKYMYSIRDHKSGMLLDCFLDVNNGTAIRKIQDIMNDKNSLFYKHADDFTVVRVAVWNDEEGIVTIENSIPVIECKVLREAIDG